MLDFVDQSVAHLFCGATISWIKRSDREIGHHLSIPVRAAARSAQLPSRLLWQIAPRPLSAAGLESRGLCGNPVCEGAGTLPSRWGFPPVGSPPATEPAPDLSSRLGPPQRLRRRKGCSCGARGRQPLTKMSTSRTSTSGE